MGERHVTISKYKDSRFWAVWIEDQLLAVVCYKKGAMAIRELLKIAWGMKQWISGRAAVRNSHGLYGCI